MNKLKKQVLDIMGTITDKYEVISLKGGLNKQRFLLKTDDGVRYFITAFGNDAIKELSAFSKGMQVSVQAGKEVSVNNSKEYINYYLNSISLWTKSSDEAFYQCYLNFFTTNKIGHKLNCLNVEDVFKELEAKKGIDRVTFDKAMERMVKDGRNNIYFNLDNPKKLLNYVSGALMDIEEESQTEF
jgi:uncharacterized protein YneR